MINNPNSTPDLIIRLLRESLETGRPQGATLEEYERLADAIFKGAVLCRVYDQHVPPEDSVQPNLQDDFSLYKAANEPPQNPLLKAYAKKWCEQMYPECGGFLGEKGGHAGIADLLSRDSTTWVECGTTNPGKVIEVLRKDTCTRFVHFEKPSPIRATIGIWVFEQGDKQKYVAWLRNYQKNIAHGGRRRNPRKKYPARQCANPQCGIMFHPKKRNEVVHSKPCRSALNALGSRGYKRPTEPMPLAIRERIFNVLHMNGDVMWCAFFALAFDTGLDKGPLVRLTVGQVMEGTVPRLMLECRGRAGASCSRSLSRRSKDALREYVEKARERGRLLGDADPLFAIAPSYPNICLKKCRNRSGG